MIKGFGEYSLKMYILTLTLVKTGAGEKLKQMKVKLQAENYLQKTRFASCLRLRKPINLKMKM